MRIPAPDPAPETSELGRVHLVGIGGAGLSGIARIMLRRGLVVTGSDQQESPVLQGLTGLGAVVHVGHDAAHLQDADTVVVSTAVNEDNPEYVAARHRGLRVLPRSAALASLMSGRRRVAVSGTHGKTTTASMLTGALQEAGADPTYAIGGDMTSTGVNADEGTSDLFVAEADESDGAFLAYRPHGAVVTSVDADHLDQWGSEEAYRAAFDDFVDTIEPGGFLVAWADSAPTLELAARARERYLEVRTYGESPDADLCLSDVRCHREGSTGRVRRPDGRVSELELVVPGRHYAQNAAAVLATGLLLGHSPEALTRGLGYYRGTRRRMERKGVAAGVTVVDSYAHHPREIAGDLQAARALAGPGRVLVAYQPHLVSRTRLLGAAMGQELGAADEVVVLDVYVAREEPDPGVSGALVADQVPLPPERVAFVPGLETAAAEITRRARPGDLVLTLGAGDVTELGPQVLRLLQEGGV